MEEEPLRLERRTELEHYEKKRTGEKSWGETIAQTVNVYQKQEICGKVILR